MWEIWVIIKAREREGEISLSNSERVRESDGGEVNNGRSWLMLGLGPPLYDPPPWIYKSGPKPGQKVSFTRDDNSHLNGQIHYLKSLFFFQLDPVFSNCSSIPYALPYSPVYPTIYPTRESGYCCLPRRPERNENPFNKNVTKLLFIFIF